jgi:hypothetical protein
VRATRTFGRHAYASDFGIGWAIESGANGFRTMLGIVIFGTKPIERAVGTGSFFCPTCQRDAPYDHRRVRQVFTLYFIPVFPLGSGTEIIRCGRCGSEFSADVLQCGLDQARPAPSPWTCRSCGNTNPPEYAHCVACQQARDF